jgi:potassium/chloride transporter 9
MTDTTPLIASAAPAAGGHEGHKNALGTFNGCYIPCCLNILGIILFLKLGWAVGQAGILGVLGIFAIAELMAILTVLSFSAIVTNGSMSGGGSYYMISRSLGPEFGGAIGLLFYLAYAIGCGFYLLGFATSISQTFFREFILQSEYPHMEWLINVVIGTLGLIFITSISMCGAGCFAKLNGWLFVVQTLAIIVGVASYTLMPSPTSLETLAEDGNSTWVYGLNTTNFASNLFPEYTGGKFGCPATPMDSALGADGSCTFKLVFAIVFPAATGIMEGANLSGDLRDPGKSIPRGTILAVCTAIVTYIVMVLTMGASFDRTTLRENPNFLQEATGAWTSGGWAQYFVVVGIVISSISSALGSLFGGSRVLQALSRDDLFAWPLSFMSWFKYGSPRGDEPLVAVAVTFVLAQLCVLAGDIDVVAPVITSFFCMSYCLCNLTCFTLKITGAPNFRPAWKCYTWWSALAGAFLNLGIMFWLSWYSAAVSILCLFAIWIFIYFKGPDKGWGDVTQAIIYHQVRKFLLKLEGGGSAEGGAEGGAASASAASVAPSASHSELSARAKFWRPSILVLVNRPCTALDEAETELIMLCNALKKGGLLILGEVVVGSVADQADACAAERRAWLEWIHGRHLKAFPQVTVAPSLRVGAATLMSCSGLGAMDANTVAMTIPSAGGGDSAVANCLNLVRDARDLRHNIMLAANTGVLNDMEGHHASEAERASGASKLLCRTGGVVHTRCSIDVWLGK